MAKKNIDKQALPIKVHVSEIAHEAECILRDIDKATYGTLDEHTKKVILDVLIDNQVMRLPITTKKVKELF